jgi:DNA repair protein RadC
VTVAVCASAVPHPTGRRSRTQDRILELGADTIPDADILALILGTGGGGAPLASLSADLLEDHGGVSGLLRAGVGRLAEHCGVGPAKAARLVAAIELGRRAVAAASREASPRLFNHVAVVAWAKPRLAILDHEELWVLALDGRHGLRAARRAASGGIHGLQIGVRDVLRTALREAASSFIMVHNHPSGDPTPSEEDIVFTRAVAAGGGAVGTPLVDHVIIARDRSSSMLDLGLVAPL